MKLLGILLCLMATIQCVSAEEEVSQGQGQEPLRYVCRDVDEDGWPEWYIESTERTIFSSPFAALESQAGLLTLEQLEQEIARWPKSANLEALLARRLHQVGRTEESLEHWKRVQNAPDRSLRFEAAERLYLAGEWGEAFQTLGDVTLAFPGLYPDTLEKHPLTSRLAAGGWKAAEPQLLTRNQSRLYLEPIGQLGESRPTLDQSQVFMSLSKGTVQISSVGLQLRVEPKQEVTKLAAELAGPQGVTEELGRSVEGRPILAYWLGGGEETVVFFGAFHGDEPESAEVCEKLWQFLRDNPDLLVDRTAVIVPVVNPDGLHKGTRLNANTVDLNRNYPTDNWSGEGKGSNYWGGSMPASEPETKVVLKVLERFQPTRIVSIHCPYKCVNYDGPAAELAQLMSEKNGYKVEPSIGYPTPGSFGNFAGVENKIPTITLELPPTGEEDVWSDNREALVRALRGE